MAILAQIRFSFQTEAEAPILASLGASPSSLSLKHHCEGIGTNPQHMPVLDFILLMMKAAPRLQLVQALALPMLYPILACVLQTWPVPLPHRLPVISFGLLSTFLA